MRKRNHFTVDHHLIKLLKNGLNKILVPIFYLFDFWSIKDQYLSKKKL